VVYAEEYLHGKLNKIKFVCTEMIPNRLIKYRLVFPLSFLGKNMFIIEPNGQQSCTFTAKGMMRSGPLYEKLARDSIEATRKHIREEGENLKKILEEENS
jgi:hypothetical protein